MRRRVTAQIIIENAPRDDRGTAAVIGDGVFVTQLYAAIVPHEYDRPSLMLTAIDANPRLSSLTDVIAPKTRADE